MARTSSEPVDVTVIDDRPIAVRRKRRSSTALVDPLHEPKVEHSHDAHTNPPEPAKTPSKPKKKVRISDPGPDISSSSLSSTGLTPALCRTSFAPFQRPQTPRLLNPSRRCSVPNLRATTRSSPCLSSSPGPLSGEIQFKPLCAMLDDRVKRRLRRRHLSEEQNEIDAGMKSEKQYQREIQDLKDKLALARKLQMHEEVEGGSSASRGLSRVQELENELIKLKEEMRDPTTSAEALARMETSNEPPTPSSIIFIDDTAEDFIDTNCDTKGVLKDRTPAAGCLQYNDVATQDTLIRPEEAEILKSARLSLEYLFPGEIALGLVPADAKALLDTMLERLQTLKTQTLIAADSLSRTQTQESNLRTQFDAILEQLERARKYAEKVGTKHAEEKSRADTAETNLKTLEASAQDASARIQELEDTASEKERSIRKLQDALGSYRIEVGKLELLISRMEKEHKAATAKLKSDMDEAVADLECHVTAETSGRRAAEAQVEQRDEKIRELRTREAELMNAVNEKQQIIRETEQAFHKERTGHEREVGKLNVQIGQLSTNLGISNKRRQRAEQEGEILVQKLKEEKDAGLRAVAAVQAELKQCSRNAEGIRDAHVSDSKKRGADVMEHKGLLTPTTGGRFRDGDAIEGIEGFVEVHRGKKGKGGRRPDSGIVILEADEDEDLVMDDY
ncbi:MAG: hypothetical protein Q9163_002476 [Psora crenata]